MEIVFPDDIYNSYGTLKYLNNNLIDISTPEKNLITIDNIQYVFTYLNDDGKNKGGNSIILKLFLSENIDSENLNYGKADYILKILKFPIKKAKFGGEKSQSQTRFEYEIEALNKCKEKNFNNIIEIHHSGNCKILNYRKQYDNYLYYTMETATSDLKNYIEANHNKLFFEEKLALCISISEGLKELRELDYYHRDIKPDNIFIIEKEWKIGDLGLINKRDLNFELDTKAEPIGPRGWMTPESMNKYLTESKGFGYRHNCSIDHQSDIFQIGKVFWYIFQHNAPIGSISEKDFKIKEKSIYPILRTMLNHSKEKRYKSIEEVIYLLKKIEIKSLKGQSIN